MPEWSRRFQNVLATGGPRIVYQPIVNLWTATTVGYEALSRFPDGSPDDYFEQARRYGYAEALEVAAIENALTGFPEKAHAYLSLNASPALILSGVLEHLELAGTVIELTEATPVHDYRALNRKLDRLRSNGVRLAIDDLGSGYGSLQHVTQLYPDTIKLDRSLVSGLHRVEEVSLRAVLGSMSFLASALQMDVVAEGIESQAEALALRGIGFNFGQGFYYSEPLEAAELAEHS